MSVEQNVETLSRFSAALERGDLETAATDLAADVEIDDRDIPDADGQDSFFEWISRWNGSFESWRTEPTEVLPAGEDKVLSLFRMFATGKGSGIELARDDALLAEFREGKICRIGYYNDQSEARAAAGLERAGGPDDGGGDFPSKEALVRGFEALSRQDLDVWLEDIQPDAELHELAEMPDAATYRGHEEIRRWAVAALDLLEEWEWTPEEFLHDDGATVLTRTRISGRGQRSSIPIEQVVFHVFEMRDGKVADIRAFQDRPRAFEAAGLPE